MFIVKYIVNEICLGKNEQPFLIKYYLFYY